MKTKDQKIKEAVSRARISWEVNRRAWERYDTKRDYLMTFVPKGSTYGDLIKYGVV